jgi:sodium-dependent dicarboxylate transporter 2/3/5
MTFWWITAPVDYAVTGLLPLAINAIFQVADMQNVASNYSSDTILLLLGASIITVTWTETGLDRRIAAGFMRLIGGNYRKQIIFWYMLSAILSAVLPNAVVVATITPIAFSMLKYIGEDDIANSKVGSKILMMVAYGAGVGGLATPLGGAMNLVVVEYIQKLTGKEFMYIQWVIRFLPIIAVIIISNLVMLLHGIDKKETIGGSKEYFEEKYRSLPKMKKEERIALWLFLVATVLAFTRQFYAEILPGLVPAYSFIICGILAFIFTKGNGERLLLWKNAQTKIGWDMLFIFAGGLAVGTMLNESGAAKVFGQSLAKLGLNGGFMTIMIIIAVTLLMSDFTSNTATAAVALPIVISLVQGLGKNPIPYIYCATIGINLSYMMPTSIRAIPVGYGLQPKYMLKSGWKISICVIVLESALCYMLMKYWPAFSTTI